MDRERAEVQYRPVTMHLVCPDTAPKFSSFKHVASEGAEVVDAQAVSIHGSQQCQARQAG